MRLFLFWIIQMSWGMAQTLLGFILYCFNYKKEHVFYHGAIVTHWDLYSGLSLGPFIFIHKEPGVAPRYRFLYSSQDMYHRLLVHEYGHCIQSLLLGPLYLILIGIPSFVWANVGYFSKRRRTLQISYYRFYTERWANYLGHKVTKEVSMEDLMID